MCLFCKKKKKNNTALKVVAIVFTSLAALAAAYVIFEKFFKDKILKLVAKKKGCESEAIEEDAGDDTVAEVTEAEVFPESAEADAE